MAQVFVRAGQSIDLVLSVISVNTNFDGAQPKVRVGGRHPTSGVEDNFERSTSSIGESQAPKKQDRQNPKTGKVSSSSLVSSAAPTKAQRESVSPDEVLAAARARVAKLESALRTVGEDETPF